MPDVTETEPDQPPSDYVRRLAEEAQLRNVMRQAQHKEMQAKMRAEEKLLKARRKGEPTKLAEGRLDRATRRCEEARDALADAA